MNENNSTQEQPKTRVTRITMGRVYNLGNYENERVELAIDIAEGDDPAKVYANVRRILANLRAKSDVSGFELRNAQEMLAKPEDELDEFDKKALPKYRAKVEKHEQVMARRQAAREALSTLEFSSQFKDHKQDWDDDDYDGDY